MKQIEYFKRYKSKSGQYLNLNETNTGFELGLLRSKATVATTVAGNALGRPFIERTFYPVICHLKGLLFIIK